MAQSFPTLLDGPFIARVDDPRSGRIRFARQGHFYPECFPQSLFGFLMMNVMVTMNIMMMIGWAWRRRRLVSDRRKQLASRQKGVNHRESIRVGKTILWFEAREKRIPRPKAKHMERAVVHWCQPLLHICGARAITYASTHIGVSIRAGRHHSIVSINSNHSCDARAKRRFFSVSSSPFWSYAHETRERNQMHCWA
jgi:hypothetical protein